MKTLNDKISDFRLLFTEIVDEIEEIAQVKLEKQLDENTLFANQTVQYKGELYQTGNRKGYLVELYRDGKFFKTVNTKYIKL